MRNQPRPSRLALASRQVQLDQRRRALLAGGIVALIGVAILLRPHHRRAPPSEGDDAASLARLINLPAVPTAVHWSLKRASADADPDDLSKGSWTLDADLAFAPGDAAKIAGPEIFLKPPFKVGRLERIGDNRFRLFLASP